MELSEQTKIVRMSLIRLGIKCDFSGFEYLVHAIEIVIENPHSVFTLNQLIHNICRRCNEPSRTKVEANIQHAINKTYDNRGFNGINDLFGMDLICPDHKPSIGELVRLMAEYYLLEMYKTA